ncbi:hypothetical protein QFC22_000725 [Naganishia vaughanmartiniae]|uniref:Uncharacterized protein n=1 Tax=Naganishia vaughanmartiniae TaxID=1424756 RepID=A0ACC2XKG2_9TREE|nr:hypothetical protein QFC22_000725 [Naganishia vaughanmartiniae]
MSALFLDLPSGSGTASRAPARVTIHPSVLAQILDHHARRPTAESDSSRVIGTLLGVRHADTTASATAGGVAELEIRSCFALPHSETESQVAVDMDYHKNMTELMGRVTGTGAGKEVIVGWYSSSAEINPYSALIHNFFAHETGPAMPAIHLTIDTEALANGNAQGALAIKAYVAQQVGANPKPQNNVFLPVPCSIKYHLTEKAGLDLLVPNQQSSTPTISVPPLQTLSQSLQTLTTQIGQIESYVAGFSSSSSTPSATDIEVGKYLLDAVGRWKSEAKLAGGAAVLASDEDAEKDEEDGEEGVKKGLQDALSVSYLSALVRSQVELSARLNLLA